MPSLRRSWKGVVWGATFGLTFLPSSVIALRCYRAAQAAAFRPPRQPIQRPESLAELGELRDVRFGAGPLRGWYSASRRGAAVILTHGSGADRCIVALEALALARAGFGVLLFDWPGHGESPGEVHWSQAERTALRSAIDFLATQPDVDQTRIGLFGFSMGAYIAAQVAPSEPRLRAFALAGAPTSIGSVTRWQYGRWGPISYLPAQFAFQRGGLDLDFDLREAVRRIAPRPLLVVSGERDGTVPVSMARELYAAASQPKEIYVSPTAGHGGYVASDPRFAEMLVNYFTRNLPTAAPP